MISKTAIAVILLLSTIAAGCGSRGASPPPPAPQTSRQEQVVGVFMREFEFEPRPLKVKAGMVHFRLVNRGTVDHDFAIPSLQGHNEHETHLVKPGETKIVEIEMKPGTYEAVCTIPGHKEAGMTIMIEVGS